MLDDEMIIFLAALLIAFVVFVIILNPYFWQAFRNAKYWDKQDEENKTHDKNKQDMIEPF